MDIQIGSRTIDSNQPTYFIADIAANHDGLLERARLLIRRCKPVLADIVRAALAWPPGQANIGGTPVRDGRPGRTPPNQ